MRYGNFTVSPPSMTSFAAGKFSSPTMTIAWFETSYRSYGMFLPTLLFILGLAPILGAMLPGSSGFLQADFRLNTTLILTMSWSWFGLAFYGAALSAITPRSSPP